MKIRSGFVSNSSSSSFIIAFDASKFCPCPHCGRKDISILDLIESKYHNSDTEVIWSDATERIKQIQNKIKKLQDQAIHKTVVKKDSWFSDCVADYEQEIKLIKDASDKGLTVAEISISYHDEYLNSEFNNLSENGKLEILRSYE